MDNLELKSRVRTCFQWTRKMYLFYSDLAVVCGADAEEVAKVCEELAKEGIIAVTCRGAEKREVKQMGNTDWASLVGHKILRRPMAALNGAAETEGDRVVVDVVEEIAPSGNYVCLEGTDWVNKSKIEVVEDLGLEEEEVVTKEKEDAQERERKANEEKLRDELYEKIDMLIKDMRVSSSIKDKES